MHTCIMRDASRQQKFYLHMYKRHACGDSSCWATDDCPRVTAAHQCDGVLTILPSLIFSEPCLWALLATLTMRALWASSGSSRLVSKKGPKWLTFSCWSSPCLGAKPMTPAPPCIYPSQSRVALSLATLTMRALWASSNSSRLVSRKGPKELFFSC